MRAVAILALCALLAGLASATDTAPATQAQARALEERWKNCSAVLHGRLGALHPEASDEPFTFQVFGNMDANTTFTAYYSPCELRDLNGQDSFVVLHTMDYVKKQFPLPIVFTTPVTTSPIAQFFMPVKKGDVARFEAQYTTASGATRITVITQCAPSVVNTTTAGTLSKDAHGDYTLVLSNINACPRFPYTNKYMPAGGVAALVVLLVVFALELAVCGWYHKTYSHDLSSMDDRDQAMH